MGLTGGFGRPFSSPRVVDGSVRSASPGYIGSGDHGLRLSTLPMTITWPIARAEHHNGEGQGKQWRATCPA